MRARGVSPCTRTASAEAISSAAAASLVGEETAAVSRPPSHQGLETRHLLQAGAAPRPLVDREALVRGDLALEASLVDRGQRPGVRAQRPLLHLVAGDLPLLGDPLGAVELAHRLLAVARTQPLRTVRTARRSARAARPPPTGEPQRHLRHVLHAARDHEVAVPDITACAAKCTACCEDPHCRSIVTPGTCSGSPAASHAVRAMSVLCGPTVSMQPNMTSSTAPGIRARALHQRIQHVRTEIGRMHGAQRAAALPTAVRTAPTM
jgi:hypothetical protein